MKIKSKGFISNDQRHRVLIIEHNIDMIKCPTILSILVPKAEMKAGMLLQPKHRSKLRRIRRVIQGSI